DRIDITSEDFYRRLMNEPKLPSTTQPTPNDFAEVYEKLARETAEILVITVSSKLSGTYQSALQAKDYVKGKCRIEVVDSLTVAMAEGLIVEAAVRSAKTGLSLDKMVEVTRKATQRSHLFAYFDTLKYLAKGGRIGKAKEFLGSMLSVKQILTVKEGEMAPLTRVHSMKSGFDYLMSIPARYPKLESIAVEHTTNPKDGDILAQRLAETYPKVPIYRSVISPVVGTYSGPGALALSVLEAEK
ncbi:MAG: DegV family protein, partial [Dehalococcoidales bacterium]|nr:DegV family protein [Dehalococcoidales bacterium]